MFKTVKRIIHWCGAFKKNLYIGFVFSFFSGWFAAMPVIWAAFLIGRLVESAGRGEKVSTAWVGKSIGILMLFIFLRFLFDYLRARFQEAISYKESISWVFPEHEYQYNTKLHHNRTSYPGRHGNPYD